MQIVDGDKTLFSTGVVGNFNGLLPRKTLKKKKRKWSRHACCLQGNKSCRNTGGDFRQIKFDNRFLSKNLMWEINMIK